MDCNEEPAMVELTELAPETALYPGDCGELALETRRVLVQLLIGPVLEGRRHSKLWPVLVRDETLIRCRLADLFLDLLIDREQQVAFIRQADTGELEVPILLRRAQLTLIDSLLLLHLRHRLTQSAAQGERAVVSVGELNEALSVYRRVGSTDQAGFEKRVHASIEKIKKLSLLRKIRASEDRFEISPTLKLLFSAEEIQALRATYQRMTSETLNTLPTSTVQSEISHESG